MPPLCHDEYYCVTSSAPPQMQNMRSLRLAWLNTSSPLTTAGSAVVLPAIDAAGVVLNTPLR